MVYLSSLLSHENYVMKFARFMVRRVAYMAIQLFGAVTIAFFLIRLIPGDPAIALAGPAGDEVAVRKIRERLGLDQPLLNQYTTFLQNLAEGDLGFSIYSGHPVSTDLRNRVPATLEITTLVIIIAIVVGLPLGMYVSVRKRGKGIINRILFGYGMLTGAIPDFWLGLIFIYVFFFLLSWAPPPMGRFSPLLTPPINVTGFLLIDSIYAGDSQSFWIALKQLVLPVATLAIIITGAVVKMTRTALEETLNSDYVLYARACGLPQSVIVRYALRNALPPVITVIAAQYGFLLGGAVLVEKVFAWGGVGEYAVNSIASSDYAPITGFILVSALNMAVIFLLLDIAYKMIDPRIEH